MSEPIVHPRVPGNAVVDKCGCLSEVTYEVRPGDGEFNHLIRVVGQKRWCPEHSLKSAVTECEHVFSWQSARLRQKSLRMMWFAVTGTLLGCIVGYLAGLGR